MRSRLLLAAWLTVCGTRPPDAEPPPAKRQAEPGAHALVGRTAPPWSTLHWLEGIPVPELEGKVVLVRFFTDTCPFCRATAPALAALDETYRARGLRVVGVYHPKPPGRAVTSDAIRSFAERFGWTFPVAVDLDWSALDALWPTTMGRDFTSVSLLIDRRGTIAYVHPGPEYHRNHPDYPEVVAAIEAALADPDA